MTAALKHGKAKAPSLQQIDEVHAADGSIISRTSPVAPNPLALKDTKPIESTSSTLRLSDGPMSFPYRISFGGYACTAEGDLCYGPWVSSGVGRNFEALYGFSSSNLRHVKEGMVPEGEKSASFLFHWALWGAIANDAQVDGFAKEFSEKLDAGLRGVPEKDMQLFLRAAALAKSFVQSKRELTPSQRKSILESFNNEIANTYVASMADATGQDVEDMHKGNRKLVEKAGQAAAALYGVPYVPFIFMDTEQMDDALLKKQMARLAGALPEMAKLFADKYQSNQPELFGSDSYEALTAGNLDTAFEMRPTTASVQKVIIQSSQNLADRLNQLSAMVDTDAPAARAAIDELLSQIARTRRALKHHEAPEAAGEDWPGMAVADLALNNMARRIMVLPSSSPIYCANLGVRLEESEIRENEFSPGKFEGRAKLHVYFDPEQSQLRPDPQQMGRRIFDGLKAVNEGGIFATLSYQGKTADGRDEYVAEVTWVWEPKTVQDVAAMKRDISMPLDINNPKGGSFVIFHAQAAAVPQTPLTRMGVPLAGEPAYVPRAPQMQTPVMPIVPPLWSVGMGGTALPNEYSQSLLEPRHVQGYRPYSGKVAKIVGKTANIGLLKNHPDEVVRLFDGLPDKERLIHDTTDFYDQYLRAHPGARLDKAEVDRIVQDHLGQMGMGYFNQSFSDMEGWGGSDIRIAMENYLKKAIYREAYYRTGQKDAALGEAWRMAEVDLLAAGINILMPTEKDVQRWHKFVYNNMDRLFEAFHQNGVNVTNSFIDENGRWTVGATIDPSFSMDGLELSARLTKTYGIFLDFIYGGKLRSGKMDNTFLEHLLPKGWGLELQGTWQVPSSGARLQAGNLISGGDNSKAFGLEDDARRLDMRQRIGPMTINGFPLVNFKIFLENTVTPNKVDELHWKMTAYLPPALTDALLLYPAAGSAELPASRGRAELGKRSPQLHGPLAYVPTTTFALDLVKHLYKDSVANLDGMLNIKYGVTDTHLDEITVSLQGQPAPDLPEITLHAGLKNSLGDLEPVVGVSVLERWQDWRFGFYYSKQYPLQGGASFGTVGFTANWYY